MPPKNIADNNPNTDENVDRDAEKALRAKPGTAPDVEPENAVKPENTVENEARAIEIEDEAPAPGQTAVDKLAAEIEPRTDAVGAVEALVRHVVDELRTAPDVEKLGEEFAAGARRLAEAALAGANAGGNTGFAGSAGGDAGFNPTDVANDGLEPHNRAAVESAVAHGMDRDEANAMTTHGSNA